MDRNRGRNPWNVPRSARDAYRGLWYALTRTRSLQLGVAITMVALVIGWALRLPAAEWVLILLGGTLVLAIETLNTAIEMLCNYVHSGTDPRIGRVKDVAAGATAWTEIGGFLGLAVLYAVQVWHLLGH
jgi:diacylglycerol kinase (ATP)